MPNISFLEQNLTSNLVFILDAILAPHVDEPDLTTLSAALMLSHLAWNTAIEEGSIKPDYYQTEFRQLELAHPHLWKQFIGDNRQELIDILSKRKLFFFPNDKRLIKSCWVNLVGTITVKENNDENTLHLAEL